MTDTSKILSLFRSELVVVNVGPKSFADVLEKQGYKSLQVDWKPAAGGDKRMQELLDYLGGY
ncbi:MAG: fdrA domain protein [Oscillospiraceae bacterium]|jgi:FdrA protein|nr:fdrA domain protein [Oscillospiraceae bacterium]MBQ6756018.1 fdrA domain protein [Oscillospiraceae bacterium]MBR1842530.1 fdrA domain protein [Oscillospiraceae bacterium]